MRALVMTLALTFAATAMADGEAEYKYREGVMKTAGGHMSSMAAIMRGRVHFDNFKIHARGMADVASIMPGVFPPGSNIDKSESLPAIWENPGDFKAAMDEFVAASNELAAAAEGDDMGKIGAGMQRVGKSCKGCHDNFREEH